MYEPGTWATVNVHYDTRSNMQIYFSLSYTGHRMTVCLLYACAISSQYLYLLFYVPNF